MDCVTDIKVLSDLANKEETDSNNKQITLKEVRKRVKRIKKSRRKRNKFHLTR